MYMIAPVVSCIAAVCYIIILQFYSEGSLWTRGNILSCGLHHAAVLKNGDLYTWGATKNGK